MCVCYYRANDVLSSSAAPLLAAHPSLVLSIILSFVLVVVVVFLRLQFFSLHFIRFETEENIPFLYALAHAFTALNEKNKRD